MTWHISDILFAVRKSLVWILLIAAAVFAPQAAGLQAQESPAPQAPNTPPQAPVAPQQTPVPPPPPAYTGPTIVLDPAHGGTDSGARGESIVEKDIVLQMARAMRAELERAGYRVVLTRNDDSNPSYDDRAAIANAYRDAIFVSVHAASTGASGTVRAYYMELAAPIAATPVAGAPAAAARNPVSLAGGLTPWEVAQRPYVAASHRLADLIQGELAQAFPGSPPIAAGVPVRALRSVAGAAVAVEISSVATPTPDLLTAAATPMGAAIERAIAASRQASAGTSTGAGGTH